MVPALRVEPENAPLGVAHRSFGMTKPHSSRLDWRFFRLNRGEYETSTDPRIGIYLGARNRLPSFHYIFERKRKPDRRPYFTDTLNYQLRFFEPVWMTIAFVEYLELTWFRV